jgi:HD-GYP domain-containing protein (c-di-GMP phosphodiesterase class II)
MADFEKNYQAALKKFLISRKILQKNRLAFKRLLRNYLILKKKYLLLRKYSASKVTQLIENMNKQKYSLIFDHNQNLLKISDDFLTDIEMSRKEFAASFYIDILFNRFLPQPDRTQKETPVKPFQFPIMIKNFENADSHIHPYLYFMIQGKIKYLNDKKIFCYLLSAENISATVELNYFQKTDTLITSLTLSNYNLQKAKKTIDLHKMMLVSLTCSLVEEYNRETSIHIKRIRKLTTILSDECKRAGIIQIDNYNLEDYVRDINYTSVLHDIGKMGIPNEILAKEEALNDEEYRIMKKHPEIGSQYIKKIIDDFKTDPVNSQYLDFLTIPYEICLHHHERWDGSGYPSGLKEDQIPISARIVAVADAYDAMRANRVYTQKTKTHEQAVSIIKSEAGKHFDPKVVDAFLNVEYRFSEINYDDDNIKVYL